MEICIQTLTKREFRIVVEPSDRVYELKAKLESAGGYPLMQQRLIFEGQPMKESKHLSTYGIQHGSLVHVIMRGMISTFTDIDTADPTIQFLMLTDEERLQYPLPITALQKKAEHIDDITMRKYGFQYDPNPEIIAESQTELLREFLNFMWSVSPLSESNDLKLVLPELLFLSVLDPCQGIVSDYYEAQEVQLRLYNCFREISKNGDPKIALRMTKGPTNACIGFHRDGPYATGTLQLALNDCKHYSGGRLCFFKDDQLHILERSAGSMVRHHPLVLHGVTNLTAGVRQSLFVVDEANGLGAWDVVEVTHDHVRNFHWYRNDRQSAFNPVT